MDLVALEGEHGMGPALEKGVQRNGMRTSIQNTYVGFGHPTDVGVLFTTSVYLS